MKLVQIIHLLHILVMEDVKQLMDLFGNIFDLFGNIFDFC